VNIAPVGTATQGAGLWGQLDLAGEMYQWNLDWYASTYVDPCTDCAYLASGSYRVIRGGYFESGQALLLASVRNETLPNYRESSNGFRCARTP
jgi:formylglycine-generating enzyme required for sulfatase activity